MILYDNFSLGPDEFRVVSQPGLDHPLPVLGIKFVEELLLFEALLELLVVGLHIEVGVVLEELLYLEQSLIPILLFFCEKGDRLMMRPESLFDFFVGNSEGF